MMVSDITDYEKIRALDQLSLAELTKYTVDRFESGDIPTLSYIAGIASTRFKRLSEETAEIGVLIESAAPDREPFHRPLSMKQAEAINYDWHALSWGARLAAQAIALR